jgi:N-methyl-L-proline demethylase
MEPATENASARPHDPLLSPFRLRGLTLRNRIVSTSHASMLDAGGLPLERYQRYHEEKAKGGLALTMIGGSAMTSADSSWGGGQLNLTSDAIIPHLAATADRVHRHGAAIMCQVSHLGRRATATGGNWLPALAPSRVRETRTRSFPKEMDRFDIDRIIRDYAEAARRCRDAGLDGVETLTGGHLLGQFLSPRTNLRTDVFGGLLHNRARFVLMVHEAIRKAVGGQMVIGIRYVVDEGVSDGLTFADSVEVAQILEREGLIDFFNCIYGRMDSDLLLSEDNMPGMFQRSAPFLSQVAAFRREVKLPVMHAAAIRDVATARHVLREGIADLVGMTRAHIADPEIVNKIARGEEARIRPCVGASYCLYRKPHCIHNPATARETEIDHHIAPAPRPKRALVVGGGPAGLEAARVLAERGHRVSLLEAAGRFGGQVLVAAAAPGRENLRGIVDWREAELARLGVEMRLNAHVAAQDILAELPEIVVLATGGIPDLDWFDGAEHCDTVWDILTGIVPARPDAVVYDGTGRQAAGSCALTLGRKGGRVRFVTPDSVPAAEMSYTDSSGFRKGLYNQGIATLVDHRLTGVSRSGNRLVARFVNEMTGMERQIETDQVIVENGTIPVDDLYRDLRAQSVNSGVTTPETLMHGSPDPEAEALDSNGKFALHRIGDCVASRDLHATIHEAFRLCSRL